MSTSKKIDTQEQLKLYLKIGEINVIPEEEFVIPDKEKNKLAFMEPKKFANLDRVKKEYSFNKIFFGKDEYSYIYEDMTNTTIPEVLAGKNYFYLSYGENCSEKHSILFGKENSHENLNSRGLFPRLIESFLNKNNCDIEISLSCIYRKNLIDLTSFLESNENKIKNLSRKEIIENFKSNSLVINNIPEIVCSLKTKRLNAYSEIDSTLKNFNLMYKTIFDHIHVNTHTSNTPTDKKAAKAKTPHDKDWNFFEKNVHFIYTIYVSNTLGTIHSNITICELAGYEDNKNNFNSNIPNDEMSRIIIENESSFESIKTLISGYTRINHSNEDRERGLTQFIDSENFSTPLYIVLKKNSFADLNTRFRVIGCILPNVGAFSNTKEILDFLNSIQKNSIPKILTSSPEQSDARSIATRKKANTKKDDKTVGDPNEIMNLKSILCEREEKILSNKKQINELKEEIKKKDNQFQTLQENYRRQTKQIATQFGFRGDINVLLSGAENTKEAYYARQIRESVEIAKVRQQNVIEMEKQIEKLKMEVDKYKNLVKVAKDDVSMLDYYANLKEANAYRVEKLKLELENSKKLNEMKEKNKNLAKINEGYKKNIEEKDNLIRKFNDQIGNAIQNNKDIDTVKKQFESEYKEKVKKEVEEFQKQQQLNHQKEISELNSIISQKNKDIIEIKKQLETVINKPDDKGKILNEAVSLYIVIIYLLEKYKSIFNEPNYKKDTPERYVSLINTKEKFEAQLKKVEDCLNRLYFPFTLDEFGKKNVKCAKLSVNTFLKLEGEKILSRNKDNTPILKKIDELTKTIEILTKENTKFKERINTLENQDENIMLMQREINNLRNENVDLKRENENLIKSKDKLDKIIFNINKLNSQREVVLESQKRALNKLNNEKIEPYIFKKLNNGQFPVIDFNSCSFAKNNYNSINNNIIRDKTLAKNKSMKDFFKQSTSSKIRPKTGMIRSESCKVMDK